MTLDEKLDELAAKAATESEYMVAFPDSRMGPGGYNVIRAALTAACEAQHADYAALESALKACVEAMSDTVALCDNQHHPKKDRGHGPDCPPVERFNAALAAAREVLK